MYFVTIISIGIYAISVPKDTVMDEYLLNTPLRGLCRAPLLIQSYPNVVLRRIFFWERIFFVYGTHFECVAYEGGMDLPRAAVLYSYAA